MPFFGKYQKTYSKKNPSRLKYDESLYRIAIQETFLENENSGQTSSTWKDDFDKILPEK